MDANSLFSYQGGPKWIPETWIWIALRSTRTVGHFYGDFISVLIFKLQEYIKTVFVIPNDFQRLKTNTEVDVKIGHLMLNMIFLDNFHQSRSLTVHNAGCFICFSAKNNLTPTWFEHAAFWSGVRRATIAPRSPSYRKRSNCWRQCVHNGTSKNDARNLSWRCELWTCVFHHSYETILSNKVNK